MRRSCPQAYPKPVGCDPIVLDGVIAAVLDCDPIQPIPRYPIPTNNGVPRITQPEAIIRELSNVVLEYVSLGETRLKGVIRREASIVPGDVVMVAAVAIVGPYEKAIAAVAHGIVYYPVVVRVLFKKNARRVGRVEPESTGITDTVVCPIS
jgi:hypothetical protein